MHIKNELDVDELMNGLGAERIHLGTKPVSHPEWNDPNILMHDGNAFVPMMVDFLQGSGSSVAVSPRFKGRLDRFFDSLKRDKPRYRVPEAGYFLMHDKLPANRKTAICTSYAVEFFASLSWFQTEHLKGQSLDYCDVLGWFAFAYGKYLPVPVVLYIEEQGMFIGNDFDCIQKLPPPIFINIPLATIVLEGPIVGHFAELMEL